MAATLGTRQLFGGAITMDLPVNYGDASDLRQIPDNQEVYLSPDSDTSLVVEVLGLVEDGPAKGDLWEAAKFHFSSIAHDNASISSTLLTPPPPSPLPSHPSAVASTPPGVVVCGTQKIHKFSHDPTGAPRPGHEDDVADTVFIAVALFRVWLEQSAERASGQGGQGGQDAVVNGGGGGGEGQANGGNTPYVGNKKKADIVVSVNVNLSSSDGKGEEEREKVQEWWEKTVRSVSIVDFGLFGDSE